MLGLSPEDEPLPVDWKVEDLSKGRGCQEFEWQQNPRRGILFTENLRMCAEMQQYTVQAAQWAAKVHALMRGCTARDAKGRGRGGATPQLAGL